MIRVKNISKQPVSAGGRIIDPGKTSTTAKTLYSAEAASYLYNKLGKKIEIYAYSELTEETKPLKTEKSFIEYLDSNTFVSETGTPQKEVLGETPPEEVIEEEVPKEVPTEEAPAEEVLEEAPEETPSEETPVESEIVDSVNKEETPVKEETQTKKSKRARKK